jgi:8-oxo-dGTP pyrophosphatase MutT (NUDIX family)
METSSTGRFQRLKAVCVISQGGDYLFAVGVDPLDQRTFLVPVGGGIEFGELALTAAVREAREEIGIDVENPRLLGILENIFRYKGETDHEVVFCFIGQVRSRESVPSEGVESDGISFPLRWLSEGELRSPDVPVYPEGILDLILNDLDGD